MKFFYTKDCGKYSFYFISNNHRGIWWSWTIGGFYLLPTIIYSPLTGVLRVAWIRRYIGIGNFNEGE